MNVVAIGAHFDDIELGCGGAIAKHVEAGDNVTMVVVTNGEYHWYDGEVIRGIEEAFREGRKAAEILGVKDLICLNKETKKVEYGVELIEQLNAILDNKKADIVYTHWVNDIHQDHSAIARATLNAARHLKRVLMYRSNWYHSWNTFNERFFIDISKVIDKKIESIKAHGGEYQKRGEKWVEFVKHQNRNAGIQIETEYAEGFEIAKYLLD